MKRKETLPWSGHGKFLVAVDDHTRSGYEEKKRDEKRRKENEREGERQVKRDHRRGKLSQNFLSLCITLMYSIERVTRASATNLARNSKKLNIRRNIQRIRYIWRYPTPNLLSVN